MERDADTKAPEGDRIEWHERKLTVALTNEEKQQRGLELAQAAQELDSHGEEAKAVKADLKAKETEIIARISSLANKVRTGSEIREVRCFGIVDLPNGRVKFYRSDTEEFVGDRVIRSDERQVAIPGTEAPAEAPKEPFNPPRLVKNPEDDLPAKPLKVDDYEGDAHGAGALAEDERLMQAVKATECGHVTEVPVDATVMPALCADCAAGKGGGEEEPPEQ